MKSCQGQTGVKRLSHNYFMKWTSPTFKRHLAFSQDGDDSSSIDLKTMMNVSEHRNFLNFRSTWLGDLSNTILCIHFFFEHFSWFHPNTRQHSDPHCASQSVVDSSSNKIFAPLPDYDWFLCWSYCSAAFCCFLDGNRKWHIAYYLLEFPYFELYLMWIFSRNSHCH